MIIRPVSSSDILFHSYTSPDGFSYSLHYFIDLDRYVASYGSSESSCILVFLSLDSAKVLYIDFLEKTNQKRASFIASYAAAASVSFS